jgi:HEPN domain-containing protein
MARGILSQARRRLSTAKVEATSGSQAYAVRAAQECTELSLKAALRLVGIEYPKKHDVAGVLLSSRKRFPDWFGVEEKARISTWLAERREAAMYGDELKGKGPDDMFTRKEAMIALRYASQVYRDSARLVASSGAGKR